MSNLLFRCLNLITLFCVISGSNFLASLASATEDNHLSEGKYILNGGNGTLSLRAGKKVGSFSFSIHTDWANGHVCDLEGHIVDGRANLEGVEKNKPCIIKFLANPEGIEVEDDHEICGYYCGARAGMAGLYLKPPSGCSRSEVSNLRTRFKQLYSIGNYEEAETILKPLISDCQKTIDFINLAWIRNDLAITQYKLGRLSDCRLTLEPLANTASTYDGAREDDPNTMPEYFPFFPVMKATLTNLKLCSQKQ